MIIQFGIFLFIQKLNYTHPRGSDAFFCRDAVELDACPRRRRGALFLIRDIASLQGSHLGTVRRRLFGAKSIRDDLVETD